MMAKSREDVEDIIRLNEQVQALTGSQAKVLLGNVPKIYYMLKSLIDDEDLLLSYKAYIEKHKDKATAWRLYLDLVDKFLKYDVNMRKLLFEIEKFNTEQQNLKDNTEAKTTLEQKCNLLFTEYDIVKEGDR